MFFIIVIAVFALMYGYIGWRLIVPAAFSLSANIILWSVLVTALFLPFLPLIFRFRGASGFWADLVAWIGFLSFGFFTLLFAILVAKDVILLVVAGFRKISHVAGNFMASGPSSVEVADPQRRQLIMNSLNIGVVGLTGALTGYGMFEAMRNPEIVEVEIPVANLPGDLEGFRIVQITDIHVSHTIKRRFVQSVVNTVNDLKPDLVALTGDLADGSVNQLREDVAPLADLRAPCGSYFITGNHEYYSGVEQWLDETARLGFTVLMNEHKIIDCGRGRLLVAGVPDISAGRQWGEKHISDPHKALHGAAKNDVKILLAHQPKSIFEASRAGYDYVISGHTHGGQYFPYHFLAAMAQPYISGFHNHDGTRIYVSKGTGYWGPQLRIGARSEITVHRLRSA